MLFSTIQQGLLFLWMMVAGVLIGAWYGLTLGLRRQIRAGFWLTLACDLLFGVGCAVILCAFLIAGNYGALRPFELLGAACGALLFLFAMAAPLRSLGRWLSRLYRAASARLRRIRVLQIIFK